MASILNVLWHFNNQVWGECDSPDPLRHVLETAVFRATEAGLPCVKELRLAIKNLDDLPTAGQSTEFLTFYAAFTRKAKRHYEWLGYGVYPSIDAPPGPFLVESREGLLFVVTVFFAHEKNPVPSLDAAIDILTDWRTTARYSDPTAQGAVVLAPFCREADRALVTSKGFFASDLNKLHKGNEAAQLGLALDHYVGRLPSPSALRYSLVNGEIRQSPDDAISSFFGGTRERVLLVVGPPASDSQMFSDALFRSCASHFSKRGPPAPLPIGIEWRSRGIFESGCDVLRRHGMLTAPTVLAHVVKEGICCPVLSCSTSDPEARLSEIHLLPRLRETRSQRSKAIVIFSSAEQAAAQRLRSALSGSGCETRLVRAIPVTP
ncbi:MAG: hypothetical protein R3B70_43675 [Polyangiaceae bacterium]